MENKYVFRESVGYLTSTISRKLKHKLIEKFNATGLNATPEQWRLLVLIYNEGEMYQSQLADIQQKDRAGIKRLVDHLIKNGLVSRKASNHDARTNIIALTPEGQHVVSVFNEASRETVTQALSCFSASEAEHLKLSLNKLLDHLN